MAKRDLTGNYRVTLEDGSGKEFVAANKTDARRMMNKWLTNECGYDGRYSGPRPKIANIEKLDY